MSKERAPLVADSGRPLVRRFRDVLYWIDGDRGYVLSCDSNAGIGERPGDALRQPPTETGYSAAKVALMEVLATGAAPFVLTNALGGPRDDYGLKVLAGIEAAIAELDTELTLTGSDETNVPTAQTSVGITVIGSAPAASLRLGRARPGDVLLCVGVPKDGLLVPYTEGEPEIANLRDLAAALRDASVSEALPVGSRGVAYEAAQLAAGAGAHVRFAGDPPVDLTASAGSSTCFLVAGAPELLATLPALVRPPVGLVGEIVESAPGGSVSVRKV